MKSRRRCDSPPPRGGVAATSKKKTPFRSWSRRGGQNFSDHPGRAFLTFDGASTPPLEEGNRSELCDFISLGNAATAESAAEASATSLAHGVSLCNQPTNKPCRGDGMTLCRQ